MAAVFKAHLRKRYVPKNRGKVYYDYIVPYEHLPHFDVYFCLVSNGGWKAKTMLKAEVIESLYKLDRPMYLENK